MKVFEVKTDGLPKDIKTGCLAFIFDGCIVSGWPIYAEDGVTFTGYWEADSDVGRHGKFVVEKYVVFDKPIWEL